MGLGDVEEGEENSSRKKSFIKQALAYIKIRRQANRVTRNIITRDRAGAHERLVAAFFSDAPMKIRYFLVDKKCTSAIRQLAYDVNATFLDEYMQISERSSRKSFDHFCQAVMDIYGHEYLRKPTPPLFNDLKTGRASEIPFVANDVTYRSRYYLVDGIYPKLAPLIKTIPGPSDDDHKRILYKQKQKFTRKDVERAFGVLKKKWAILVNPTRALKRKDWGLQYPTSSSNIPTLNPYDTLDDMKSEKGVEVVFDETVNLLNNNITGANIYTAPDASKT
nr:hypothetical protein [Tanacetum cinerariifolium]